MMNKIVRLSLALAFGLFLLLAGCTPKSEPTTQPGSTITEEEAIAIASELLPAEAVARAKVMPFLRQELGPHGKWQIQFYGANVTKAELGWQEDANTKFVGSDEVLQNVIISIDVETGEVLSRTAGTTVLLGGPTTIPSDATNTPTISEPAPSFLIGEHFYYGQDCIWEDTLVGLEYDCENGNKIVEQYLYIVDLDTYKKKRVLEVLENRMADTPSIYGNKVVWASVDRDEFFEYAVKSSLPPLPNYDVFLLDLETGEVTQLTTEEHAQRSPRIYGDTVVWLDARHQTQEQYPFPFDIYAYDLKTGQEMRVTASTTVEGYNQIAIDGGTIVWTDMRHADMEVASHAGNDAAYNNEIYAYDLNTGEERRLTTSPKNDQSPDIYGNTVTWLRQEDFQKADIFLYDLESGLETQVSTSGYAAFSPSIYGNKIVWADARSSGGNTANDVVINGQGPGADIYIYYLDTKAETKLTTTEEEEGKVWQSPVIYGDYMVYEWNRQTGPVVYVMQLPVRQPAATPTETTSALTEYFEDFQEPPHLTRLVGENEQKLKEIVLSDARIQELIKDQSYDFEIDGIRIQGSDWHLSTGVILKEGLTAEQRRDFAQQSLQGQIDRDAVESFRGQLGIGSGGGGVVFPFFLDIYDIIIDYDSGTVTSISLFSKALVPRLTLAERKQAVAAALNDAVLQEILQDKTYQFAPTGVYVIPDKDYNKAAGAAFEIWLDKTYEMDIYGTGQTDTGSVLAVGVTFADNTVYLRLQGGPS